ncbi:MULTISPECIES: carbohydrate ABC transporter permease [Shouchella]|uniref:Sugar ABC transporter permease n=2 Tax=Shouchella TaxID=2893057 RepID=A0ABY7W7A0_9BACI|nr:MULTISPECIES: sugar ABC transporter permease [Shouchella]MED4128668.1 sugar ABC transporter permease [Shouchella miscanthi]WDF04820.1 sugar ABC transporter permease [Shouchella hunanensis]
MELVRKKPAREGKRQSAPYIFIAPAVLLLLLFAVLPIIIALTISFTDMDLRGISNWSAISFVGIENYRVLLSDPIFWTSMYNTFFYVIIGVPLVIISSLGAALLLNYSSNKLFRLFRVIYYMPAITNIVAIAVIWGFLYNVSYGLFNQVLLFFNTGPVPWLEDPTIAKLSLIILAVWKGIGINMLIYLAALQSIPKDYYEAATIDGASRTQQFFKITFPLLGFATFFITVTTLIGWLQFFEEPFVMTEGGPLDGTISIALFIYQAGFSYSNFGYAAAASFVLFVIIIIATLIQFTLRRKQGDM